jgi:hypothetical protein
MGSNIVKDTPGETPAAPALPPSPYFPAPEIPQPPRSPASRRPRTGGYVVAIILGIVAIPVLVCALAVLSIGGFAAFWATHQVPVSATSTQTFLVSGAPVLTINDPAGQVQIVTGTSQQIVVQATRRASDTSQTRAQQALDGTAVQMTQQGNAVTILGTITTAYPLASQRIDLMVTVPAQSSLAVTLAAGDLHVTSVDGLLQIHVTAGNAVLQDVTLQQSSTVMVTTGNLQYSGSLAANASATITVNAGNADVRLSQGTAISVRATTDVGNITVSGWTASVQRTLTGATAQVNLSANPTSDLTVLVHTGNITLGLR